MRRIILCSLLCCSCTVGISDRNFLFPWNGPAPVLTEAIQRKNVEIAAPDGIKLRGWELTNPSAVRTVVYFYGNGGSVLSSTWGIHWLAEALQANVLCVDYRGYGFSDGKPTLESIATDGLVVYDYASASGLPVVVAGQSLGGVIAAYVAAQRPVAAAVLLAPPTSFEDAIENIRRGLPWFKRIWVRLELDPALRDLHPTPTEAMPRINAPVAVVLGTDDDLVPLAAGKRLYNAAPKPDDEKLLCTIPGAGHDDVSLQSVAVQSCVKSFMDKVLARQNRLGEMQ